MEPEFAQNENQGCPPLLRVGSAETRIASDSVVTH